METPLLDRKKDVLKYFCTPAISLKLSSLGFKELCIAFYTSLFDDIQFEYNTNHRYNDYFQVIINNKHPWKGFSAPLHDQIVNWLLDEHDIKISRHAYNDILTPKRIVIHLNGNYFPSADMNAVIDSALNLIIEKNESKN